MQSQSTLETASVFEGCINICLPNCLHAFRRFYLQASNICVRSLFSSIFSFSPIKLQNPIFSHFYLANLSFSMFFQVSRASCCQGRDRLPSIQEFVCSIWVGAMLIFSVLWGFKIIFICNTSLSFGWNWYYYELLGFSQSSEEMQFFLKDRRIHRLNK